LFYNKISTNLSPPLILQRLAAGVLVFSTIISINPCSPGITNLLQNHSKNLLVCSTFRNLFLDQVTSQLLYILNLQFQLALALYRFAARLNLFL